MLLSRRSTILAGTTYGFWTRSQVRKLEHSIEGAAVAGSESLDAYFRNSPRPRCPTADRGGESGPRVPNSRIEYSIGHYRRMVA